VGSFSRAHARAIGDRRVRVTVASAVLFTVTDATD
jgi:hypothetical protein